MAREDQMAGKIKQVKGKVNEVMGVARNDRSQEAKGKLQRGVGKVRSEGRMCGSECRQVVRGEPDRESVRNERSPSVTRPIGLHRPLHAPLKLDRLELCPEQARGLPLEQTLEEPLQGGQGSHRGRSLTEGPAGPG